MTIGFRSGFMRDGSRTDWDGTDARPISWAVWYPASRDAVEMPMRVGGPGEPWFDIGAVAQDAPLRVSKDRMPVALVSHGSGGTAASMGWIARRLAERGVVVIAANHHGNTAVEPYRPESFLCWWERARDLSVLLDHMARLDQFAGRLDCGRVLAVGFSLGCHTALSLLGGIGDMERFRDWADRTGGPLSRGPREFPDLADRWPDLMATHRPMRESWQRRAMSYRDTRVGAALLLAPAPPVRAFTDASLAAIDASVHMMIGEADHEAPAQDGADWLAMRLSRASVERLGADVGHFAFLPESTAAGRRDAPALCIDAPGVDRRAIHDAVAAAALRLFSGEILGDVGTSA